MALSDEQLKQIRKRIAWRNSQFTVPHDQLPQSAHTDSEQLLAEVERLRTDLEMRSEAWQQSVDIWLDERQHLSTQNAAMRKIVQDVADAEVYHDSKGGMLIVATPDALVSKARALLAQQAE